MFSFSKSKKSEKPPIAKSTSQKNILLTLLSWHTLSEKEKLENISNLIDVRTSIPPNIVSNFLEALGHGKSEKVNAFIEKYPNICKLAAQSDVNHALEFSFCKKYPEIGKSILTSAIAENLLTEKSLLSKKHCLIKLTAGYGYNDCLQLLLSEFKKINGEDKQKRQILHDAILTAIKQQKEQSVKDLLSVIQSDDTYKSILTDSKVVAKIESTKCSKNIKDLFQPDVLEKESIVPRRSIS